MTQNNSDDPPEQGQSVGDVSADADIAPETIQGRKLRRLEEKQYVTGSIGETCRYVGFGLVILFYTIATSGEDFPRQMWADYQTWIKLFGILGALTIISDFFQYLAGDTELPPENRTLT